MVSNNHGEQHQSPEAPRYPLPPPYFPPPGIHLETRTERGLRYINWGLWIYALVLLLTLINTVVTIFISYDYEFVGIYYIAGNLGIVRAIIMLSAAILWIIGLVYMHSGRVEYGPIHSQKFILALIFVVLLIAIPVVHVFLITPMILDGRLVYEMGDLRSYSMDIIIVDAVFGFVFTLFVSLTYVFLIIELSSAEIRSLLWVSFALNLAIYTGSFILRMTLGVIGSLSSNLVIIVFILVKYCYCKTLNRIRSREIMPLFPPGMFPPSLLQRYLP